MTILEVENNLNALVANFDKDLWVAIDALKSEKEVTKHSQNHLAPLYDPDKMPEGLQKAHHTLDKAIEQCYRPKLFESDEKRLEYLFRMYEEMTSKEGKKI